MTETKKPSQREILYAYREYAGENFASLNQLLDMHGYNLYDYLMAGGTLHDYCFGDKKEVKSRIEKERAKVLA